MRISDNEVKKILSLTSEPGAHPLVDEILEIGVEADRKADGVLVKEVVQAVINSPDRDERIAELRARIDAGTYNPSGDEIADLMIRRSIADRVR